MMRTNIVIDDTLMRDAMKSSGLKTKRAVVEAGLRLLVELRDQARAIREMKGIGWDGDLDEMRGKRRR
jgi:Arc/MetJ family transcription regulator